jgi:hypothetical protein
VLKLLRSAVAKLYVFLSTSPYVSCFFANPSVMAVLSDARKFPIRKCGKDVFIRAVEVNRVGGSTVDRTIIPSLDAADEDSTLNADTAAHRFIDKAGECRNSVELRRNILGLWLRLRLWLWAVTMACGCGYGLRAVAMSL